MKVPKMTQNSPRRISINEDGVKDMKATDDECAIFQSLGQTLISPNKSNQLELAPKWSKLVYEYCCLLKSVGNNV